MMKGNAPPSGFAIWLTGLPSSGKTATARALGRLLSRRKIHVQILDSDELRKILTPNPTYLPEERDWFYRAITFLAGILTDNGVNVLISATAPRRVYRDGARSRIKRFAEVHIDCPIEVCRTRDTKGLWEQAMRGEISTLPGSGAVYEPPISPEVRVDTGQSSAEHAARHVLRELKARHFINSAP
jgi:adenylylsulfate kinase